MKLWIENIEIPAVVYQEDKPSDDFIDRTNDLIYWDKYGEKAMHYNSKRNFMLPLFYSEAGSSLENFAAMALEKKMIAARYFFIPYAIRLQLLSGEQDAANWEQLVFLTEKGRAELIESCRVATSNFVRREILSKTSVELFYEDNFILIHSFIKAASSRLKYFLMNKVGTEYENNGFAQKSYYNEEVRDKLLLILNS